MSEPVLRLWLHMSCRYHLEHGQRVHACDNCKAIWDTTKAAS